MTNAQLALHVIDLLKIATKERNESLTMWDCQKEYTTRIDHEIEIYHELIHKILGENPT